MTVVIKGASDPNQLISSVRGVVKEIDPDQPIYSPRTMDDIRAESVAPERLNLTLLSLFATIALVLAIVGIYGVMSYSVTQRTHEIGIRMAIGARPLDVFKMILGHGMKLALIGVGLGLVGAFILTRYMVTMLFGVEPTDGTTFGDHPQITQIYLSNLRNLWTKTFERSSLHMLFGISASDPLTYALVLLLALGAALLACSIPAGRATRVDPLIALRYE